MPDEPACLSAALAYAARGWPVFPLKPRSKEPITRHGVRDCTLDDVKLRRWFDRWPEANVAIACGAPGPQALDIDDLEAGRGALRTVAGLGGPEVATARGRQFYLQGSSSTTIGLGWGELRGVGSYVVAPPSIHPTGKLYTFLVEPSAAPLPRVPAELVPVTANTAGAGEMSAAALIPHGQRHEALKDAAIRLVRSGITDVATLELMLRSFFAARCDPHPKPRRDEFMQIAVWGAKSEIATRERAFADHDDAAPAKARRKATGLEHPPRGDAPLKEHRAFIGIAGGWGERIEVEAVRRFGPRGADALVVRLSNGQFIEFEHQEQITTRGHWARTVIGFTNGIAKPVAMNELEALAVMRSLCIVADAPSALAESEALRDVLDDFIALAEVWAEHDLGEPSGRYDAIRRAHARGEWQPRQADEDHRPVLLIDRADGRRHVRSGEVYAYLLHRGYKMAPAALEGRMAMLDAERWVCRGRAPEDRDRERRRMVLYRLGTEPADG